MSILFFYTLSPTTPLKIVGRVLGIAVREIYLIFANLYIKIYINKRELTNLFLKEKIKMAIQKELPLTTKGEKKPKALTKKELVRMLEELDTDFIGTDISRIRISTLKLLMDKLS